jgi:alpha-amylase
MTPLLRGLRAALLLAIPGWSAALAQPRPAPAWTRGGTCYEIFVRSFADSDGDGIGDLRGLTARLDYLNDGDPRTTGDLGVNCLWLMPVTESPGYHGYDVSDHYRVEPDYGTNDDFKRLVAAAHARGIVVLVDMVLNHVSSDHAAFQRALAGARSPQRRLFRFQPEPGPRNKWGGDNWHRSPRGDEFFYGFFWAGMPDLNYEHPEALAMMDSVATFWLNEMGVDGFRLDAVKYLVEEGTQADDTPGTHRVLREFQAHLMRTKPGVYTVGEVFDSTATLLSYYPDQLDGYFAFEVSDSIIAGVRAGRGTGILAPALRLQDSVPGWRWSPFLRNHDQPRTVTELGSDTERAKVAAAIHLTLPGLPFVYYGEELGMTGPKPDELIRTPMAWTRAGPHAGFTTGTPWQPLAADSLQANVEAQRDDPRSLHSLYRRLIAMRAAVPALAEGTLLPVRTNGPESLVYIRRAGDAAVLVVVNLDEMPITGLRLSAPAGTLAPGSYALRDLITEGDRVRWDGGGPPGGGVRGATLTVGADGSFTDFAPIQSMPRKSVLVFSLTH